MHTFIQLPVLWQTNERVRHFILDKAWYHFPFPAFWAESFSLLYSYSACHSVSGICFVKCDAEPFPCARTYIILYFIMYLKCTIIIIGAVENAKHHLLLWETLFTASYSILRALRLDNTSFSAWLWYNAYVSIGVSPLKWAPKLLNRKHHRRTATEAAKTAPCPNINIQISLSICLFIIYFKTKEALIDLNKWIA